MMSKYLISSLLLISLNASAIDVGAYRKIDSRGMDGAKVLLIAGDPDSRQRKWDKTCGGIAEKWFYKGSDYSLEGKVVVVELCQNVVTSVTATKL